MNVNLDNYSGFWCVEPSRFTQIVDRVNTINLTSHIEAQPPKSFDVSSRHFESLAGGTIAVVDLQGTLTKAGSSIGGNGTVEARYAIRQAERDATVEAIILRIDSPGGTVSGTADLAAEVRDTKKPIVAYIEDLGASAAYWVASQADQIFTNTATAHIGSIGTFMAVSDVSGALEDENIRTIVIKAGEFKAGGYPGIAVSDEQIAEWQKLIDATQAEFTAAVAAGRGVSIGYAETLATGLVYLAADAKRLKLIDGVQAFDEVVETLRAQLQTESNVMTETAAPHAASQPAPQAASYADIQRVCPGLDSKSPDDAMFIAECQSADMTAEDVRAYYIQSLRDRCGELDQACDDMATQLESAVTELDELKQQASRTGVPVIGTSETSKLYSGPVEEYHAAVNALVAEGKTRRNAVLTIHRTQPDLKDAAIAAVN